MASSDVPDRDRPDDDGSEQPANPFAGTPFEQLLGGMGGALGGAGGAGGQMPDLGAMMGQLQQLFAGATGSGHVNWDLATQVARTRVAKQPDPSAGGTDRGRVADAARLAELWLDEVTDLPAGATSVDVWSRAEWVEQTRASWQQLVEPIATNVVRAMGEALPDEVRAMAGPLISMFGQVGGAIFGQQVGQALGELATEVVGAADVGLPLVAPGRSALVPTNVSQFSEGLAQSDEDVLLYLALRECAAQRLFVHVPWLKAHLFGAVEEFGRGTSIDVSKIESQITTLDPRDPAKIQEALAGGLFEPENTPAQKAALTRLETALALVEGWVDEVVTQATIDRMPTAVALREAVRRRRAAGGPAEQTFASLVGLDLRPRRLRDASNLWAAVRDARGPQGRDAIWSHPDLLPTTEDLDDPMGFVAGAEADEPTRQGELDFDSALAQLLDDADTQTGDDDLDDGPQAGPDDPESRPPPPPR
ncbi:MAG: zinc-dependent metalloprotease [Actinomycetota bacterium]|nr:zinc-dependent metalloprotease [Actinomycetota bacterium]